jgi:hypothetical protein
MKIDLLAPLSVKFKYNVKPKSAIIFRGLLDFNGYTLNDKNQNIETKPQPNYIECTNLNLRISFDREFAENLHWDAGIGYYYRELSFSRNNKSLNKLIFSESLLFSLKVYCSF